MTSHGAVAVKVRLTNVRCLSCKQVGHVTINAEYIGYSATCDCYDGAPVHSGDSGPSAPHGMTKAEALQTRVVMYGFGEEEVALEEEITRAIKVELWDEFCDHGYKEFS